MPPESPRGKLRILLAEDDLAVLKMTKLRLEHEGFDVLVATDGERALQEATSGQPIDLILLDVKMPKLDGLEVTRRLKADAATKDIPIIIFTASAFYWQNLMERCRELGVAAWLKKPFRSQELLDKIYGALGTEGGRDVGEDADSAGG